VPVLAATGSLQAGEPVKLVLSQARPLAPAWLVVGNTALGAPFKGGVLVPAPTILFPVVVGADGTFVLQGPFPPGTPSGFTRYFQYWISDVAGPLGFAASNAVSGTTP
jgi:hypothetical protein